MATKGQPMETKPLNQTEQAGRKTARVKQVKGKVS